VGQSPRRPAQGKPEAAPRPAPPRIFEHRPGKTIQAAIANAHAHVQSVNKAAGKKK